MSRTSCFRRRRVAPVCFSLLIGPARQSMAFGVSGSTNMNQVPDLKELLRNVVADGGFGMTLRTGEVTVVHTAQGPKRLEAVLPTHEDITAFLRRLTGSRGVREFRDSGVTRFVVPFEGGVRLVGAARLEKDDIHIEIRRMTGRAKG